MDQERFKMLQKYATEAGISVEELLKQLDDLEKRGEIGFEYLKKIIPSEIQSQEDARSLFKMVAQEANFSDTDEYIETFPHLPPINHSEIKRKFENYAITRGRLQNRNIMISPEMWHTLVENSKKCITSKYLKKTVDKNKGQIMFSQLFTLPNLETLDDTISHRKNCDALILRTIQFDFFNFSNDYEEGSLKKIHQIDTLKLSWFYDAFIKSANQNSFNNIYEIAEKCLDFSIHEYYLPFGFSFEGLKKAVLLMRYDHCRDKHINSILPKYYGSAFKPSVSDPHFHFNEGFGQVYKLLTKKGQANYGSGFAIGIPELVTYLNKLSSATTLPKKEQDLLLHNDFGMPFLSILSCGSAASASKILDNLSETATDICLGNYINVPSLELQQAYDFLNAIDGLPATNLETFDVVSNQKNHKNDQEREH